MWTYRLKQQQNIVSLFACYLVVWSEFVCLEFMFVPFFPFFDTFCSFRACFGGLLNPPARQRLLTLPPSLRHVPVQLCVLSALPLQHEGEHGNVRGSSESEDVIPSTPLH